MKNSKVSIIVPVYNSEKYLKKLIKSLQSQTYENFEVIFINDGSIDNSLEILEKNKEENFKIISQKNGGVSKARNNGLKKATGKYITFVDSDDYIDKRYLAYLVDNMEKYKVDLCVMGFNKFDDNYEIYDTYDLDFKKYTLKTNKDYLNFLNNLNGSAICGKLYKRELLNNEKFMDLSIGEDALFNLNYIKHNKKIITLNKNYYFYRSNPNSLTNSLRKNLLQELDSVLASLEKESYYIFFAYRIYQEYVLNLYINNTKMLKQGIYKIKEYQNICSFLESNINDFVGNFSLAKKLYFKIVNKSIKYNNYKLLYFIENFKLVVKYGKKKNK